LKKVEVNTFPEAKREFLNFIEKTKRRLLIMSGELFSEVYGDPDVLNAFRSAIDRGVEISVACGPEIDVNSIEIIKLAQVRLITLYHLRNREPYHFRVSDARHVFLETFHTPFKKDRRGSVFVYDTLTLGPEYEARFYKRIQEQNALQIYGEHVVSLQPYLVKPGETTIWSGKKIEIAIPASLEERQGFIKMLLEGR